MPGLTLIYDKFNSMNSNMDFITNSFDTLEDMDWIKSSVNQINDSVCIGKTLYSGYPVQSFENNDYLIFLEGMIYNKNQEVYERELFNISKYLLETTGETKDKFLNWLLNTDGDFIVIVINKITNDFLIFNDIFGRLPFYFVEIENKFLISREISFLLNFFKASNIDTTGLSQYLLFGYPLGEKTLFEGISYMPPASIIKSKGSSVKFEQIFTFNFDEKTHSEKSLKENVSTLVKLFNESCKYRTQKSRKSIISLSGGLDSRAIAASYHHQMIPFESVTYHGSYSHANLEIEIASELANAFESKWSKYELTNNPNAYNQRQICIKQGLNFLGVSYLHEFLQDVQSDYGTDILYFTGDGGDKIFPDLKPNRKFKSIDELVEHIISHNQLFPPAIVSKLTGIPESKLIDDVKNRISNYPEKTYEGKYVHFLVYGRGIKWLFEGEDRNRYYFWSLTPFYSPQLFTYAMNCPDSQKSNYVLYREILLQLSEKAARINVANWNAPLTSSKFIFKQASRKMYKKLPEKSRKIIKARVKRDTVGNKSISSSYNIFDCLDQSQVFNIKELDMNNLSKKQYEYLITLNTLLDKLSNKL